MDASTVVSALHFDHGIVPAEYDGVFESLHRLDDRLRSFPDGSVDLRLNVNERGTPSQRTILEARIAGQPSIIATSDDADLQVALGEVRDEMIRQITDAKNRSEPRHNHALRESL